MLKKAIIIVIVALTISSCGKKINYDEISSANLQMAAIPICSDGNKLYYSGDDWAEIVDITNEQEKIIVSKNNNRAILDISSNGNEILYNSVGLNDYIIYSVDNNGEISEKFTINQDKTWWACKDFIYSEDGRIYYFAYGNRVLYCYYQGELKEVLTNVTSVFIDSDCVYYADESGSICVTDKQFSNAKVLWEKTQLKDDNGKVGEYYKITDVSETVIKDISVINDTIRFIYGNGNVTGSGLMIELNKNGEYKSNTDVIIESYQYYEDSIVFSGYSLMDNKSTYGIFLMENNNINMIKELPTKSAWGIYIHEDTVYYGEKNDDYIALKSVEL